MRIKVFSLLLLFLVIICAGCPKEQGTRYITVINKSERKIVCQEFWSARITDADTLFQCRIFAAGISADTLYRFSSLNSGWETDFKAIPYIQFLIMDAETYSNYIGTSCDTVRKYVPILHCYRLKLEDLQRMDWIVVYPPKE